MPKRGSVLIAVLWSLFFLAALAAAIYAYVAPQIGLAGRLQERLKLRYAAQAGMMRAVAALEEDETESYDAFNDVWAENEEAFKDVNLGEGTLFSVKWQVPGGVQDEARYGLTDEERKININTAPEEVLKRLLETAAETTSQQAGDIAASILDWIDLDEEPRSNGAEKGYYAGLSGGGYPCKDGKFEVLEELLLVKGMTQEIFDKVKDSMTVYSAGTVNINTAGETVLEALGMNSSLAQKVAHFRRGHDDEEATEDDNIFDSPTTAINVLSAAESLSPEDVEQFNSVVASGSIAMRSDVFRGESWGLFEDRDTAAKIVFVVDRNQNIKYWRED